MKLLFTKFLLLTYVFLLFPASLYAEIKPPNYDFNIGTIELFFPGKSIEDLKKDKALKSDIFEDKGDVKILRYKLIRSNYKLDIYVQIKGDKITDLFVRLPQHFLHDPLLAELQKKYKKQDSFVRKDMSALYIWKNRDGNNIIYQGICSISCFPMFIEFVSTDKSVVPMYQKFNEALPSNGDLQNNELRKKRL